MTGIYFARYEVFWFVPTKNLVLLEIPNVEYRGSETIVHHIETIGL